MVEVCSEWGIPQSTQVMPHCVAVCGVCGVTDKYPDRHGCCSNHHDYWVEPEDFDNPDLREYLNGALQNLNLTRQELKTLVGVVL